MGLCREGIENGLTMDDYKGKGVKRVERKDEKNHRVGGENGLNGARPIPVETPLSVIINKSETFDNGHMFPSSSKTTFNHLLQEDFTKNALSAVHGRSAGTTPGSSALNSGPSTSSSFFATAISSPPRNTGRQEETIKRRNIVEKIEKLRDTNRLESFVSHVDTMTPNQLGVNVRRFARKDGTKIPEQIRNFILEGTECPTLPRARPVDERRKEEDGDETDYEDMEEGGEGLPSSSSSSSTQRWLMERARFYADDMRIEERMGENEERMRELTEKLSALESADKAAMEAMVAAAAGEREGEEGEGDPTETCARLLPWVGRERRKMIRRDLMEEMPSTSGMRVEESTFYPYGAQYLSRISMMSAHHVRKNLKKAAWLNSRELEEEKSRNGVRKREERERREKRKAEKERESEKSDSYEETDEEEDDVVPSPVGKRSNGGAAKEKKKRRERERKRSRKEIPSRLLSTRRSSDCGPSSARLSAASRPSVDATVDGGADLTSLGPFNHFMWEKTCNERYMEIEVPNWSDREPVQVPVESISEQERAGLSTESMMRRIAELHHVPEVNERRISMAVGGRQFRRRAAAAASTEADGDSQQGDAAAAVVGSSASDLQQLRHRSRSNSTPSLCRGRSEDGEPSGSSMASPLPPPPAAPPTSSRAAAAAAAKTYPPFNYDLVRPDPDYERLSIEPPYERRVFPRPVLPAAPAAPAATPS